jgi:thioesterase domain-containing protein
VHLAGHSFGAHLVYELGQQLSARSMAPVSIVIVDANAYSDDGPFGLADIGAMAANVPRWLINECRCYGIADLGARIKRRLVLRDTMSSAAIPELAGEDPRSLRTVMLAFDWPNLSMLYRKRLAQGYRAVSNYRPRPTANRLVYLRSVVRRLVHHHRPDGGWGRYAGPGSLRILPIPGDHGSALHARWKKAFLPTLQRALGDVEP